MLRSDARVTMPPQPGELIGHEAIGVYLDRGAEVRGAPLQVRRDWSRDGCTQPPSTQVAVWETARSPGRAFGSVLDRAT
jgi:hypothetical protein